jgi:hypothetical protein
MALVVASNKGRGKGIHLEPVFAIIHLPNKMNLEERIVVGQFN